MREDVLVSVVIPAHNYGSHIGEAIDSILNQSLEKWEVIIVDDGSTDNTAEVVQKYAKQNDKIIYRFQPSKGPSCARNIGVKMSRGKFIHFLDADDLLSRNKLLSQLQFMEAHPDTDLTYTEANYFLFDKPADLYKGIWVREGNQLEYTHTPWIPRFSDKGKTIIERLFNSNIAPINSFMFKRTVWEAVSGLNENLMAVEDWDFWLRCAIKNFKFEFFDDPASFALIRVHTTGLSSNLKKMHYSYLTLASNAIKELKANPIHNLDVKKLEKQYQEWLRHLIRTLGIFNFFQLKEIPKDTGWPLFFKLYLKELNFYRKSL